MNTFNEKLENILEDARSWKSDGNGTEEYVGQIKKLILDEVIGENNEVEEAMVMATPFNAIVLGKNELRREQRKILKEEKDD